MYLLYRYIQKSIDISTKMFVCENVDTSVLNQKIYLSAILVFDNVWEVSVILAMDNYR